MEGHCSTGQSPQWAVVPMEEEEEEEEEEEKKNIPYRYGQFEATNRVIGLKAKCYRNATAYPEPLYNSQDKCSNFFSCSCVDYQDSTDISGETATST